MANKVEIMLRNLRMNNTRREVDNTLTFNNGWGVMVTPRDIQHGDAVGMVWDVEVLLEEQIHRDNPVSLSHNLKGLTDEEVEAICYEIKGLSRHELRVEGMDMNRLDD